MISAPRTPGQSAADDVAPTGGVRASPAALELARRVLLIEADAIRSMVERLDGRFLDAVSLVLARSGRVVVSGIGKSGHVARKLASTLASTGTPAYFVHPAEASHGDLGMVMSGDVFIGISYSGESDELLAIVPLLKRQGAKMIAFTGNANSTLAREADVHLDVAVAQEACPLNLAPTASTTASLALGDALAVALLDARGFSADDFARSHPGGSLGRKLLTHVSDVMRTGDAVPAVALGATLLEGVIEISRKGMGMTAVVDEAQHLAGIFTDGDLRRSLERDVSLRDTRIDEVMTRSPRSVHPGALAAEAVEIMERTKSTQIPVVDADGRLVGALNIHDLFRSKVV
ncbi:MAG: KpsF/GutQ family sugar-phosphate isomerase [bacterium]|jgi:arabinose-5-phosphate isomerase